MCRWRVHGRNPVEDHPRGRVREGGASLSSSGTQAVLAAPKPFWRFPSRSGVSQVVIETAKAVRTFRTAVVRAPRGLLIRRPDRDGSGAQTERDQALRPRGIRRPDEMDQALGRVPWFALLFLRVRRLRARLLMIAPGTD